jgi:glutaredoxin
MDNTLAPTTHRRDSADISIAGMLAESSQTITIFTLSWCSYCHALKRLLNQLNEPFAEYELDTGSYQKPALNQQLRAELRALTGSTTLPQVFIGKSNIGGYTDTAAAIQNGSFQRLKGN